MPCTLYIEGKPFTETHRINSKPAITWPQKQRIIINKQNVDHEL